jgi:hypothetical protein
MELFLNPFLKRRREQMSSLLDTRRLEDERVELSSRRSGVMEALEEVQQKFEACKVIHFHD